MYKELRANKTMRRVAVRLRIASPPIVVRIHLGENERTRKSTGCLITLFISLVLGEEFRKSIIKHHFQRASFNKKIGLEKQVSEDTR